MWPVSAPGLTYGLGRGSVTFEHDGSIAAVTLDGDAGGTNPVINASLTIQRIGE